MREMRALLRDYRRMQAEREKSEAELHPAAMERAGWWFREASVPAPAPEPHVAEPHADSELTEAERYAVIYPIVPRASGRTPGLPARLDFGPPEPEIVAALVTGTSRFLRELDQRQEVVS